MQQPQQPHQHLSGASETLKLPQEKVKSKTLHNKTEQSLIETQKRQRQKDILHNQTERKALKLKFNTSYDNLRCFISQKKPQRYRSVSTRLTKQSKSQLCLSNTKSHFRPDTSEEVNDACKSFTENHEADKIKQLKGDDQSDLSHVLLNEIIHSIEKKGIRYDWNDIEQIKSEEFVSENNKQDNELQQIFDAFSDKKKLKRFSFTENSLTNNSFVNRELNFQGNNEYYAEDSQDKQYFDFDNVSGYNVGFDSNYDKNYSFASTMQPYSNLYYPISGYSMQNDILSNSQQNGLSSIPSSMYQSNEFIIQPEGLGKDPRTTLMIKNIPNKYTIHFLSQQIDQGFGNSYDFLYLPCDTKSGANQGYGFINFIDLDALKRFYQKFHGKKWKRFKSQKICNLTYARLQGINSLIEHFQNSKVLNHKEKKYQPIIKSLSQIYHLIKKQQNCQQTQN